MVDEAKQIKIWLGMARTDQKHRVERYLAEIARYLLQFRKREGLTQNDMAQKLEISLNRYREYEQNTTDNSKGIPLDLLLRIAALEDIAPQAFVARLEGVSESQTAKVDVLEERLLKEFRSLPQAERRKFFESFDLDDETDKLIPNQLRWFVRIFNQLVRLPYGQRMRFEREVLEAYMARAGIESGSEEQAALLARLKALLRYYFLNFEETSKT